MKRVLVAEDRPASLELIRTVLESEGYEVIEASDGQDTIRKAFANDLDLVLLDLQMPQIDGFGVVNELRKHSKFATIPIVAFTASAMQGDRQRALASGFTAYIAKPIALGALRSEIRRLLENA